MPSRLYRVTDWPRLESRLAHDPGLAGRWSGAELKAWREACRLSQPDLGRRLGRSRNMVQRFETFETVPSWFVVACAGLEPALRREASVQRKRLRDRVHGRKARRRAREEAEAAELERLQGFW